MIFHVLIVFLIFIPSVFTWHAYENPHQYEKSIADGSCKRSILVPSSHSNQNHTRGSQLDLKLWPGLVNEGDMTGGGSIYGMREATEIIYKHQHPRDCSKAKFLISEGYQSGFGSEIHVEGLGLALAIASNRILIPRPTQHKHHEWQVNEKFCGYHANTASNTWSQHILTGSPNGTSVGCYYEPWTNCSVDWTKYDRTKSVEFPRLFKTNSTDLLYFKRHGQLPSSVGGIFHQHKVMRMMMGIHFDDFRTFIPPVFNHILNHMCSSKMKAGSEHYWWRAVSATYLLRPNTRTLQLIESHRDKTLDTLNGNCVSMYIRHGDKARENFKIFDFSVFGNAAKLLYDIQLVPTGNSTTNHNNNNNNKHNKTKTIYLATDDPQVLKDALFWGELNKQYDIRHSALLTEVLTHDGVGIGASTEVAGGDHLKKLTVTTDQGGKKKPYHHELEYFSILLHLNDMMKCGAFVCTIGSNFCRVVDELRATVGGKANRVFADLGNTCNSGNAQQPCLFGKGISSFDW